MVYPDGSIDLILCDLPYGTTACKLSAIYPNFFPEDVTNEQDRFAVMQEVADMSIEDYQEYSIDDATIQQATDFIAKEIVDNKNAEMLKLVEKTGKEHIAYILKNADNYAPPINEDIAPVAEQHEEPKQQPKKHSKKKIEPKTVRSDNVTSQQMAEVLTEEPKNEKKQRGLKSFIKEKVLDKGMVFEDLALKTKNRELQGKYNFIRNARAKAQNFIGNGADGVKSINSIREQVENSGKTKEFYEYMYHQLNVDRMTLENRYEDTLNKPVFGDFVTADMSREVISKMERANPEFKQLAEDVYAVNAHLRQEMVDSGVISQETADLWAEMYPHYVPVRRVGERGLNVNVPLDTGRTTVNAPVKRATGGSSNILPMFDTMAQRALQTYNAIAKNNFGVELKNTLGTTIEKVDTSIDEVIDSIDAHEGLLQEGKDGRSPTFTVFENGEKVTFEITDEMYDALKPRSEAMNYTNKLLNTASNLHRGVLTEYNIAFMATNAIKDAQDVLINSQHPIQTYKNFPTAIKQLATKGDYAKEYLANGGEELSYFDNDTNSFDTEAKGLQKIVGLPPLKWISQANNFIEKVPRIAEYIASRENGASIEVAMLDAARVTTNFAAGGDVTKFLNRNGATFLNASVQGAVQQARNFREAKMNGLKGWVQLASKFAVAGLGAELLNHLLWDDDDEYEELSDYVKQNYYIVGKYGDGKFVRIPKGRALAVIQNAFEQVKNAATGNDEVDLKSFLDLAISNLAPNNPIENNIIAPIIQVANNETWYGDDLVPTRLQDLPQAEQFDESTDAFSKWLGEKLNFSPIKINYLLDQYSGGVGDTILPMLTPEAESGDNSFMGNMLAPLKSKFTTDSVMNNQNVSDFYDKIDELTTNAKSRKATDEDILKYKYINSVNSDLGELYGLKREVQNSDIPDDRKYEKIRDIQDEIVSIARESLNTYDNVLIDGEYAAIGDRYYHKNDKGEWQKITDEQLEKQEKVTDELGISGSDYWSDKSEYDFAYEKPEKYAVAKSVGGYDAYKSYNKALYDIKADKDESGKSIQGSRKEKVIEYVNSLDIDYGERLILFKSEYNADDTYNQDIIDYLNEREDISYDDMVTILKELDFEVTADGKIYW